MPSVKPKDYGAVLVSPALAAALIRQPLQLGQFAVNATASPVARILFDRKAVIREIWISGSAIPSDPDGTMLLNAIIRDVSEAADDTIVASQDLEALITEANRAFKATLAAETTENELTVEPGDSLRFTLVNNSAAITTNADISVIVVYQVVEALI